MAAASSYRPKWRAFLHYADGSMLKVCMLGTTSQHFKPEVGAKAEGEALAHPPNTAALGLFPL